MKKSTSKYDNNAEIPTDEENATEDLDNARDDGQAATPLVNGTGDFNRKKDFVIPILHIS